MEEEEEEVGLQTIVQEKLNQPSIVVLIQEEEAENSLPFINQPPTTIGTNWLFFW